MALVEGNTHGGEPANFEQTEQDGAPAIPDEAVAQMLGHISDRASVQGGKVIDIGEVFIQAVAGQDTITGEDTFEESAEQRVTDLIETVREAARTEGVDDGRVDKPMHVRLVDEIEQKKGAFGWYDNGTMWVKDWTREDKDPNLVAGLILHEASHAIAQGEDDHSHGPTWRKVYGRALDLVMPADWAQRERERIESRYADED